MGRILMIWALMSLFTNSLWGESNKVVNLRGNWKFSLGFHPDWINPDFNDSQWDELYAPMSWEEQGFYGYDGYATYRKKFMINENLKGYSLYINLGFIDDCDEIYLNGNLIGRSGSFPPNYSTAYDHERKYELPANYLNFGKSNTLTVKVFDEQLAGGIIWGDIFIAISQQKPPLTVDLSGMWKFKTGDKAEYKNPEYIDIKWDKIMVPSAWESQGYTNYDGFAWYRAKFLVPAPLTNDRVVIMLGKIDDEEEVYLNGIYIGSEQNKIGRSFYNTRWDQLRVYYIDGKILYVNKPNSIAVRVVDHGGEGGIYEGPVGIMSQKEFVKFHRKK